MITRLIREFLSISSVLVLNAGHNLFSIMSAGGQTLTSSLLCLLICKKTNSDPNKALLLLAPLSQFCFKAEPSDTACNVTTDDVKKKCSEKRKMRQMV